MQNDNIVLFSSDDWGWKTSKYQLSIRFARHNKVLFVSSIGFRAPKASSEDVGRIVRKLKSFFRGVVKVQDNLYVLTPLIVPFAWFPFRTAFNKWLLQTQVAVARWRLGMATPYLFVFSQNWHDYICNMKRKKLVYYCVDEHSGFAGIDEQQFHALDRKMNALADVIFCSSKTLCEKNRATNPNTHHMPHGVNYELFASTLTERVSVAPELQKLPRPVILFFGHISYDWVDRELVRYLAQQRPRWSFVYVGRYSMREDEFAGLPNIHILGERQFEDLPQYCKGADVGTIPFVYSPLTDNCNPLKLPEYLSAGLPVVSTDIPEVRRFGDLVRIGKTNEEFLAALDQAVAEVSPELKTRLSATMRQHSWDQRVEDIFRIVQGK